MAWWRNIISPFHSKNLLQQRYWQKRSGKHATPELCRLARDIPWFQDVHIVDKQQTCQVFAPAAPVARPCALADQLPCWLDHLPYVFQEQPSLGNSPAGELSSYLARMSYEGT